MHLWIRLSSSSSDIIHERKWAVFTGSLDTSSRMADEWFVSGHEMFLSLGVFTFPFFWYMSIQHSTQLSFQTATWGLPGKYQGFCILCRTLWGYVGVCGLPVAPQGCILPYENMNVDWNIWTWRAAEDWKVLQEWFEKFILTFLYFFSSVGVHSNWHEI